MTRVPFLLNRFVGPFFAGVFLAAAATANDPIVILPLGLLVAASVFLSLPGKDQFIKRAFDAMACAQ